MTDGPIAWVFLIVALVFIFGGSKKLSDLGKGFGGFMKEFNKAKKEGDSASADALADKEEVKKIDEAPAKDETPKA